jgi:hypothetical protein
LIALLEFQYLFAVPFFSLSFLFDVTGTLHLLLFTFLLDLECKDVFYAKNVTFEYLSYYRFFNMSY